MPNPNVYPGLENITDPHTHMALRSLYEQVHQARTITQGPFRGTLSPDQKPTNLGQADVGSIFYATDFNRAYRWTGTGWEDAPGMPSRNSVTMFTSDPIPPQGWVLCDGSIAEQSTPEGSTITFTAPLISDRDGQQAWIRV